MKYDTHKGEMADKEVDQEDGPHLLSPTPSPSITPSVMRVSPCHYVIIISIPKLYSIPVPCPIDHTSNHTPSSLPTPAPPGEVLWLCLCSYRTLHHTAQGPHLPDQHPSSAGARETHTRVGGGQLEIGNPLICSLMVPSMLWSSPCSSTPWHNGSSIDSLSFVVSLF